MVSQSEQVPVSSPTGTATDDRGIRQPTVYPTYQAEGVALQYRSFWGAVIAGSLVAISISLLSYALMFGCWVGEYSATGGFTLSWGAAWWIVITACITLFVGGYLASTLAKPASLGWLYGMSVWGLFVPLSIVLAVIFSMATGAAPAAGTAMAAAAHPVYQYAPSHLFGLILIPNAAAWTLFTALICGLIFGVLGGMCGSVCMTGSRNR